MLGSPEKAWNDRRHHLRSEGGGENINEKIKYLLESSPINQRGGGFDSQKAGGNAKSLPGGGGGGEVVFVPEKEVISRSPKSGSLGSC